MMWPYYGDPAAGLWMAAMMLLFWAGLVALAVWLVRSFVRPRRDDDAMSTLRRRLAAGEITQDEFEKTKHILQG